MSVSAQYAASARGKCAKCQGKIDKDELVIAIGTKRYQLGCVPASEKVETQDITGISALQKGDLEKIVKKFGPATSKQSKSAAASASSGGRPKRSASVSKKKKAESSDEEEEEEEEAPAKKKAKKAAPAPKKAKAPAKKRAKKQQSDSEAEDEQDEDDEEASGSASESKSEEKKPKGRGRGGAAAKKGKAPKKEPKSKFKLPSDVVQKIRDAKEQLEGKTVNDLKEMLAKNDQTKGGTRAELIEKVADGIAQGRIPRCPKCHGGRPRFNASNGTYACPGYGDDEGKFMRCSFKSADLKREPWEN